MQEGRDANDSIVDKESPDPMFSTISGNKTETVNADPFITKGTLRKTAQVLMKVVGDF